jgi:hypothetical protein
MKNEYIATIEIEETDGRAVLASMTFAPLDGRADRAKTVTGADSVRYALCGRTTYIIDLDHVGHALISRLTTRSAAPDVRITWSRRIIAITAYGETVVRNANALAPGVTDIFEARRIIRRLHELDDADTIANIALNVWRDSVPGAVLDMTDGRQLPRECRDACRVAYRGGYQYARPGVFRGVYMYDVNSLYPAIMTRKQLPAGVPVKIRKHVRNPETWGVYRVTAVAIHRNGPDWLPVVIKSARPFACASCDKWYQIDTWLTGTDIDMITRSYDIENFKIVTGWEWTTVPGESIFGAFVSQFHGMKTHATGIDRRVAKLLLNSLYGTFGRSSRVRGYRTIATGATGVPAYVPIMRTNANADAYTPIAAAVSAYGRARLIGDIMQSSPDGASVVYANTDSIAVAGGRIGTGAGLGDYREVSHGDMCVRNISAYALTGPGGVVKMPGVGQEYLEGVDVAAIFDDFAAGRFSVAVRRWQTVAGGMVPRTVTRSLE